MKLAILKISTTAVIFGSAGYMVLKPADQASENNQARLQSSAIVKSGEIPQAPLKLFGSLRHPQGNVVESKLNAQLKGVVTSSSPDQAKAILLLNGRTEKSFSVSDEISPNAFLVEVHTSHVIINNNGVLEMVSKNNKEPTWLTPTVSKNQAGHQKEVLANGERSSKSVERTNYHSTPEKSKAPSVIESVKSGIAYLALNHFGNSLTESSEKTLKQYGLQTASKGFEVVTRNPLLQSAGVAVGDVVLSVNGIPALDISTSPDAIKSIKKSGVAKILVLRNGKKITLTYKF